MHSKQAETRETGTPWWALPCWDCHNDGVRIPCTCCISEVGCLRNQSYFHPPYHSRSFIKPDREANRLDPPHSDIHFSSLILSLKNTFHITTANKAGQEKRLFNAIRITLFPFYVATLDSKLRCNINQITCQWTQTALYFNLGKFEVQNMTIRENNLDSEKCQILQTIFPKVI